jgi:excinuclease UvrABC nuclease subunit
MYDAEGHLLYVGCTKDIVVRIRNHRHENSHFFHRVKRVVQQGPYPKARALAIEKCLIHELRPDFNSLPDRRRRYAEKKRWISDRTRQLCGGREPREVEVNEYLRLSGIAYAEAEVHFPGISNSRSPHPAEALESCSA